MYRPLSKTFAVSTRLLHPVSLANPLLTTMRRPRQGVLEERLHRVKAT